MRSRRQAITASAVIYADAYYSEMVAYADLVLPDTTYLERWDCISLLDRPIGSVEEPGRCDPAAGICPDRDVRPFQDVLIEIGPAPVPRFCHRRRPRYRAVRHTSSTTTPPRGECLAAGAAPTSQAGRGMPNPHQLERYVANGCFWKHELPDDPLPRQQGISRNRRGDGADRCSGPIVLQLYVEPLQRFRLAASGHGGVVPPGSHRERIATYRPLPFWYMPFEEAHVDRGDFPLHAVTSGRCDLSLWHSQNAWLQQILGSNRLFINRTRRELGSQGR
jgi:anaerobic selenocysteine-containing dehydrogenase